MSCPLSLLTPGALEAGTGGDPGRTAALWLVTVDGTWLTRPEFSAACNRQKDGSVKTKWTKLARTVIASGYSAREVALALSACALAGGFTPGPPPEPMEDVTPRGVRERDGHRCRYCGDHAETVDHVHPQALGGASTWDNMVAACESCNSLKADHTLPELGWSLRRAGVWTTDRLTAALGEDGNRLVGEATARRDRDEARIQQIVDDGLRAIGVALGSTPAIARALVVACAGNAP